MLHEKGELSQKKGWEARRNDGWTKCWQCTNANKYRHKNRSNCRFVSIKAQGRFLHSNGASPWKDASHILSLFGQNPPRPRRTTSNSTSNHSAGGEAPPRSIHLSSWPASGHHPPGVKSFWSHQDSRSLLSTAIDFFLGDPYQQRQLSHPSSL